MADTVVRAKRSAMMAAVRHFDTPPELAVRSLLHRAGLRFRVHVNSLPGRPDIANRRQRWAVFVHGCFWHAHDGCGRATVPKRNRGFWMDKFRRNRERDRRAVAALRRLGYVVLTVWECDVRRGKGLARVVGALRRARGS
jgi:DNA mismatch endonuclease (patch repair protein)